MLSLHIRLDGYREPRGTELAETAQQHDAAHCAGSVCPKCGAQGLQYVPLVKVQYGTWVSYRPVKRCGRCGYEDEF